MDLRFVVPALRQLDTLGGEVLACGAFSDERPIGGVAGLLDWRLAARLSKHIEVGAVLCDAGEVVMLPGRPRLPFEKVIVFGLGPRKLFDESAYRATIALMLTTLSDLKVRMAVVERPGRHLGAVDAVRGVELLMQACVAHDDQDIWTLVEPVHDQTRITQFLAEERRRRRQR